MSLKDFYADPYLHIRSFTLGALLAVGLCVLAYQINPPKALSEISFNWWHLLAIPVGVYLGGLSCVYIHNASHQSFPNKFTNEMAGYVAGIHQLWGFLGWKLIHLVHHQYSDNHEQDPHPPADLPFGVFMRRMFLKSSRVMTRRYREHWGESRRTHILHSLVLVTFTIMSLGFLAFWYILLGPELFILGYIPSLVWNHYMFAHINYYCHPKNEDGVTTAAANLTEGVYYKIANVLWHGIYYHGNHHKKPMLFNPKYMPAKVALAHTDMNSLRNKVANG